jgi:formate dehydrogenase subunit delta
MDADNLIRMANRIAEFFQAMPERAEAVEGVAIHLRRFWEPRMRQQLRSLADDSRLHGLVREAIADSHFA